MSSEAPGSAGGPTVGQRSPNTPARMLEASRKGRAPVFRRRASTCRGVSSPSKSRTERPTPAEGRVGETPDAGVDGEQRLYTSSSRAGDTSTESSRPRRGPEQPVELVAAPTVTGGELAQSSSTNSIDAPVRRAARRPHPTHVPQACVAVDGRSVRGASSKPANTARQFVRRCRGSADRHARMIWTACPQKYMRRPSRSKRRSNWRCAHRGEGAGAGSALAGRADRSDLARYATSRVLVHRAERSLPRRSTCRR